MVMTAAAKPKRIQLGRPITVTRCDNRGRPVFVVSWYDHDGRRQRISRSTEQAANEEADAIRTRLRQGQPVDVTLNQADRQLLEASKLHLKPHGVNLDYGMATLAAALKEVDIHEVVEACRNYRASRPSASASKLSNEVLGEMLNAKADRSHHTVADLRRKLTPFVNAFKCPLAAITTKQIEAYVQALNVKSRTKANVLRTIGTLMNYAKRKEYIPQNHPGTKNVEPIRVEPSEIEVFTPAQMQTLLREAPQELIPALALGAFCGMRTAEISRLRWEDVHLKRGFINVRATTVKTKVRRMPLIGDTLRAWLLTIPAPDRRGPVVRYKNHVNELLKLATRCGVMWERNALRHSFASYKVAETEDVAAVAHHCGNSMKMMYQSYVKFVDPKDAKKWFGITPKKLFHGRKKILPPQKLE
jgi:integrase